MNKGFWIALVILGIAAGAVYVLMRTQEPQPEPSGGSQATVPAGSEGGSATETGPAAAQTVTVNYAEGKFMPETVTVRVGDTVQFLAGAGTSRMWVASDVHPTHTVFDGTTKNEHCAAGYAGEKPFDQCASGTSYSFTFDKAGTWKYHDHMNAGAGGSVIVE